LDTPYPATDITPHPERATTPSGRLDRLLELRFATRRRAIWALVGAFMGFQVTAWLIHEIANNGHRVEASFVSHLNHLPDEILVQLLFAPQAMHFAIPALFHGGSLFDWHPGFWTTRIFAVAYWLTLIGASSALVRGRRLAWWVLIMLTLFATTPRYAELIFVSLSDV